MDKYEEQAERIARTILAWADGEDSPEKVRQDATNEIWDAIRAAAGVQEGCGASRIAAERLRQINAEGYNADHDGSHCEGEMAKAAACYAMPADTRKLCQSPPKYVGVPLWWPWWPHEWKPTPTDRIRELVKAGALIAAEIDRLTRVAAEAASKAVPS